jgi:hypothetical protein
MIKLSLQIHNNNIVPKHNKDCYHLPQPTTLYTLYTISLVHYKVFQKEKCKGRNKYRKQIRLGTMRGVATKEKQNYRKQLGWVQEGICNYRKTKL